MMPIKYVLRITRADLRANPNARFVFGDNVERVGLGGQAREMRGEPNAIGVVTKWAPSNRADAFFSDDDPACLRAIDADIGRVAVALEKGLIVFAPMDGLGTGLAQLPRRAPALHRHIVKRFDVFPGDPCPWVLT